MASYGLKKWGTSKDGLKGYRELQDISKNLNGSSIGVSVQMLCLLKVGLPFLDSFNFTPTSNVTSGTFFFGNGFQLAHSRIYS